MHDCHNPGETCLIRAHTLRDLDQPCEVVDERRGTGKSPDCFKLFTTVVENRRSRHSGVEDVVLKRTVLRPVYIYRVRFAVRRPACVCRPECLKVFSI